MRETQTAVRSAAPVSTRRVPTAHVLTHLALALGVTIMVFPFIWQALTSFKTLREATSAPPTFLPSTWGWESYASFFEIVPAVAMATNSTLALLLRVTCHLVVASLAAFAFARLKFAFQGPLLACFLMVLMVPPQLFVIPQYDVIRSLGWLNTVQALALPGIFSAFGVFIAYQFMRTLPPELDEAAKIDGANPFQTFLRIIIPLCRPALAAVAILTSLHSWNDLLWPLIVNTKPEMMTLPVGLATLQGAQGTDYPVLMAGALLTLLPMVAVFIVLQKQFIQGIAMSGLKG